MVAGFLKDSEKIHRTGMSTSRIVTMFAVIQPDFCLVVTAISVHPSRARRRGAENPDEEEGDDRDTDEDQDGDRRPDAEVQSPEQVVVPQDRHGVGAVAA